MISREDLIAIAPIFNQTDHWALPSNVQVGMVGCFIADRSQGWDPFIVTAYDAETHMITVAKPFMRMINGLLEFGHDTAVHSVHRPTACCRCVSTGQGDDGYCICGAYQSEIAYMQTLDLSPDDFYKLETFVHFDHRKFNWIYHQHMTVEELERIFPE